MYSLLSFLLFFSRTSFGAFAREHVARAAAPEPRPTNNQRRTGRDALPVPPIRLRRPGRGPWGPRTRRATAATIVTLNFLLLAAYFLGTAGSLETWPRLPNAVQIESVERLTSKVERFLQLLGEDLEDRAQETSTALEELSKCTISGAVSYTHLTLPTIYSV